MRAQTTTPQVEKDREMNCSTWLEMLDATADLLDHKAVPLKEIKDELRVREAQGLIIRVLRHKLPDVLRRGRLRREYLVMNLDPAPCRHLPHCRAWAGGGPAFLCSRRKAAVDNFVAAQSLRPQQTSIGFNRSAATH